MRFHRHAPSHPIPSHPIYGLTVIPIQPGPILGQWVLRMIASRIDQSANKKASQPDALGTSRAGTAQHGTPNPIRPPAADLSCGWCDFQKYFKYSPSPRGPTGADEHAPLPFDAAAHFTHFTHSRHLFCSVPFLFFSLQPFQPHYPASLNDSHMSTSVSPSPAPVLGCC
jgi:hypothetical protein